MLSLRSGESFEKLADFWKRETGDISGLAEKRRRRWRRSLLQNNADCSRVFERGAKLDGGGGSLYRYTPARIFGRVFTCRGFPRSMTCCVPRINRHRGSIVFYPLLFLFSSALFVFFCPVLLPDRMKRTFLHEERGIEL